MTTRRSLCLGAALAFVAAGLLLLAWGVRQRLLLEEPYPELRDPEPFLLPGGLAVVVLAWLILIRRRPRALPSPGIIGAVFLLGSGVAAQLLYLEAHPPFHPPFLSTDTTGFLALGFGALAVTCAVVSHLLALDPSEPAEPLTEPRHRQFWLGAFAALTALALVAQPLWLAPLQATRLADPPVVPPPAVPQEVSGEVAWTATLHGLPLGQGAGTRGPVLLLNDRIIGLDGADGSILWEREVPGTRVCPLSRNYYPEYRPTLRELYLLLSPDGAHAAYSYGCPPQGMDGENQVMVVDTATGREVAHMFQHHNAAVQLTNETAWINNKYISLRSGAITDKYSNPVSLTATETHFVSNLRCETIGDPRRCTIVLADQASAKEFAYDNVLVDADTQFLAPQGWMFQVADDQDNTVQALHLLTGETVALGQVSEVLDISRTRLVWTDPDDALHLFDPSTRQITTPPWRHLDLPTQFLEFWPTDDVYGVSWDRGAYSTSTRALEVSHDGETVRIPFELPAGTLQFDLGLVVGWERTRAWAAPGCVMAQGYSIGLVEGGTDTERTYLACIR